MKRTGATDRREMTHKATEIYVYSFVFPLFFITISFLQLTDQNKNKYYIFPWKNEKEKENATNKTKQTNNFECDNTMWILWKCKKNHLNHRTSDNIEIC